MKHMRPIFLFLVLLTFLGCNNGHDHEENNSGSYYTCPMHPQVMSESPGACPVCNMSLIKVEKNEDHTKQGNYLTIDAQHQKLAGIITDTVKRRSISSVSTIIGTVATDETEIKTINARVSGRIDKMFVKSTGNFLKEGDPLYSIYSEQLLADEKEYLSLIKKAQSAKSNKDFYDRMVRNARKRLELWGLNQKQIAELEKSEQANALTTFYASESGYVTEVHLIEGAYVNEGDELVTITSLTKVWIEAQIYPNESKLYVENNSFEINSESDPNRIYKGNIVFKTTKIESNKRIELLRISVDNKDGSLIPGMMVYVSPDNTSSSVLCVPKSAVLLEKMKTVWVLAHGNTFEQRMVKTGIENDHWIEITAGLKEGEVIVTEGAYLINSEFILKSGSGQRHEH